MMSIGCPKVEGMSNGCQKDVKRMSKGCHSGGTTTSLGGEVLMDAAVVGGGVEAFARLPPGSFEASCFVCAAA